MIASEPKKDSMTIRRLPLSKSTQVRRHGREQSHQATLVGNRMEPNIHFYCFRYCMSACTGLETVTVTVQTDVT